MEENLRRIYSGEMDLSSENEKTTLTVDEEDILRMADAIRQNRIEDKLFEDNLDMFLESNMKNTLSIGIGRTPNSLIISGANSKLDIIIAPRTIIKCMSSPENHYHGHELDKSIMKQLPKELRNPVMIFKGSHSNSLVAVTELKDKNKDGIIVTVSLNSVERHCVVNRISSIYGKRNIGNYIKNQMVNNNLIACNKEKTDNMFQSLGLQLPPEETFIGYNNSISYTMQNVKGVSDNVSKINEKNDYINENERDIEVIQEKTFSEQIDDYFAGKFNRYDDFKVCDTPQILLDVGCEQLPMLYTQRKIHIGMA